MDLKHEARRRHRAAAALAGLIATGLVAGEARAQFAAQDTDAPLDITSDRLESEENVATWIGAVQVVQGEAILTTERLVIYRNDDGDLDRIEALGDVRYDTGNETISGAKAVYAEATRTLTMTGDVVVTQGKQVLSGGALVYWIDTGKLRFTAPEGQRIRGIFYTKSLETQS